MKVIIGCSSYNGAKRLDEMIRSLALRTTPPTEELDWAVIIVDDGSPKVEETRQVMRNWAGRLTTRKDEGGTPVKMFYMEHPKNRGISAGWNSCARFAKDADVVVLVNDDVIFPSGGWLEAIVHPLKTSPEVGGVGLNWHAFLEEDVEALLRDETSDLAVVPRDPMSKAQVPVRRDYEAHPPGRVMCPTGQLFAFRKADFDAVGGFDEGMKSFYEESDFGTAFAQKLGKVGCQLNWPMVWHRWSATFSTNPELNASHRMARSRQRYIEKYNIPMAYQTHEPGKNVFDFTNPLYLGAIPDVTVEYIKKDGTVGTHVLEQPKR